MSAVRVRLLAGAFATVVALGSAAVLLSAPVLADPSLGNWSPAAGAYTINTTTLQLTGPGTSFTGLDDAGVATFTFGTVDIPTGVTITVSGSLPLALVANTAFTSAGTITGEGESSTDFTSTGTGSPGGPGGGAGGPGGLNAGSGPGVGGAASGSSDGAGGGGFGGVGAAGGAAEGRYFDGGTAGLAGAGYGNLLTQLQGGSGGGGATSGGAAVDGGGGGGAIEIVSPTGSITLSTGAVIDVDGGGGAGGGGQIAEVYNTLGGTATNTVTGGTSYVRSTSGCCTGSPSSTQPDPTGAVGSIVLISPPTTTTATADTPSPDIGTTETLNATVSTDTIPAPPTGTVVFSDPGGTLCTAVLTVGATSSSGSCTYTLGAADTGAITATFDPSGPYAASTTALAITIGVAIPVAGANPDPLGIVSGAAMLVVGLVLLSLSAVGSRRRTFG